MSKIVDNKFKAIDEKDLIVSFRVNRNKMVKIPIDYFISVAPLRIH